MMADAHPERQFPYNEQHVTYSAPNNEQPHVFHSDNTENNHRVEEIPQGPWWQALFSRIRNVFNQISFSSWKFWGPLAFIVLIVAIIFASGSFRIMTIEDPKIPGTPNKTLTANSSIESPDIEEPEITHGSVCEKYFDQVKEWLDESFRAKIRSAAEKLDQIEPDIEKRCFPSKKGVNLEIYFKMGFIYFRANMNTKSLKWLGKIENVLYWHQGASLSNETVLKTFLILATWYIQRGEYVQAETTLERARETFEDCKKEFDTEASYLESWLKEVFGELNLAKYLSSNDQTGKVHFYRLAEAFYNEAINLRENLGKFRIAGSAQCMLARLYIEAREFEKAEQMNNEGAKNIKRSTEKIYTMASCIKNDALIKLGRGQASAARARFQEALNLLDEVLPKGNDLIIQYRKEFSKIFSSEL